VMCVKGAKGRGFWRPVTGTGGRNHPRALKGDEVSRDVWEGKRGEGVLATSHGDRWPEPPTGP
jgi:hypothetical protein